LRYVSRGVTVRLKYYSFGTSTHAFGSWNPTRVSMLVGGDMGETTSEDFDGVGSSDSRDAHPCGSSL
jgi:hypothetical protein